MRCDRHSMFFDGRATLANVVWRKEPRRAIERMRCCLLEEQRTSEVFEKRLTEWALHRETNEVRAGRLRSSTTRLHPGRRFACSKDRCHVRRNSKPSQGTGTQSHTLQSDLVSIEASNPSSEAHNTHSARHFRYRSTWMGLAKVLRCYGSTRLSDHLIMILEKSQSCGAMDPHASARA